MSELTGSLNPYRYEDPSRVGSYQRRPEQRFDRVAFALRALGLLKPTRTRVAVFASHRLEVQQGVDLARGPDARWVMLGVPEDASAESIVLALTKLERGAPERYVLDVMLGEAFVVAPAN